MQKDHFELLLEDIDRKLDGLNEGISALPTREELKLLTATVEEINKDTIFARLIEAIPDYWEVPGDPPAEPSRPAA